MADEPLPDCDLTDTWPTVLVAPELVGRRDYTVIREADDTDADYEARVHLLALLRS